MAGEPYFADSFGRAIAFWLTLGVWFGYLTALLASERDRAGDRTDRVLLVCTVGGLALGFFATYRIPEASLHGGASFGAGLAATWVGLGLGEWARRVLGGHYHPVVRTDDGHVVVTSGPYRVIRHPVYAGQLLSLLGLGLAMGNWLSLTACLLLPVYGFTVRIRVEEQAMIDATSSDYEAYCKRTWRLIPRIW